VRALRVACAFLTRLPVGVAELRPGELGRAAACFALVGFGIGGLSYALLQLSAAGLGRTLSALLAVAASALISGGLHLDGLADFFDALGGGRGDRQRMLEIMRDPRIGAHGASALVLLTIGKVSALAELPASRLALGCVCAPAAARMLAVWLLYGLPSARGDGLGQAMAEEVRLGHALFASACFALGAAWFGAGVLAGLAASAACAGVLAAIAKKRLGGITGDVCGAVIETAELGFLIACRLS
jgi:adenosylcobinamide-GDP ribazoletransferase